MMKNYLRATHLASLAASISMLAACGGGGSDGGGTTPPAPGTSSIGGTVSGLKTGTLTLLNSGKDALGVSANGVFTFATAIANTTAYAVSVQTQPNGQACTVSNGTGTATANVSNIVISCVDSSTPVTDLLKIADVLACPSSVNIIKTTAWSSCVVGKRLLGQDTFNAAVSCELKVLANGAFEFKYGSTTYSSTGAPTDGIYTNTFSNRSGLLAGVMLFGTSSPISEVDFSIKSDPVNPSVIELNQDALQMKVRSAGSVVSTTINCSLDPI
jgi:hypothetical protein